MQVSLRKTDILALILAAVWVATKVAGDATIIDFSPEAAEEERIEAPTSTLQLKVLPIRSALREKPMAAAEFAQFYLDLATVLENDSSIKTVEQFVQVHDRAGELFVKIKPDVRGTGVGALVKEAAGENLNVAFEGESKQKIIDFCKALAWAADGARSGKESK